MSLGIVLVVLIAAAATAWVVAPLTRADAAQAERIARQDSEGVDLQSRREMVMGALRDLEDDRATEKITEGDYAELHAKLTTQAVEIMKRIDALEARGPKAVPPPANRRDASA